MKVLVTGGAGYIGSHAVRALLDAGHDVRVLDNLSTGHRVAVDPRAELVVADLRETDAVTEALFDRDAVLHFAARSLVAESCERPLLYWDNNVGGSVSLLTAMERAGVERILFSSTAATYGVPAVSPITEDTPQRPINPYGASKLAVEAALHDVSGSRPAFAFAILRYFNVAGCAWGLGEDHDPETHLVPIVLQCASGRRPRVAVFGTDYATPDGSCVRDYVHVRDLVDAHLVVLEALQPGDRRIYNIGSGRGWSVREVMAAAKTATGVDFEVVEGDRRPGDPASLVTDPSRIASELGWRTRHSDLGEILTSHWSWTLEHPTGWR
ncbi:MAG: UDP-glucose 4-epimerase GalE [Alphaproteobacteria bacterium]|nr:UDP-glucose 4-epimerase GalE [Alphaproteobacteria bacterium]MCB9693392.1 UDP-glucose 4-epimerase GalE [Alphaproteobacteria bacterium]